MFSVIRLSSFVLWKFDWKCVAAGGCGWWYRSESLDMLSKNVAVTLIPRNQTSGAAINRMCMISRAFRWKSRAYTKINSYQLDCEECSHQVKVGQSYGILEMAQTSDWVARFSSTHKRATSTRDCEIVLWRGERALDAHTHDTDYVDNLYRQLTLV